MPSIFTKRLQEKKFADHKRRMREMKSSIDNAPPPKMPLSWRNELERRRVQALIEQDNRLLLDRLATAMSMKNIDNEPKKVKFLSLGENVRKKELTKIMLDNKRLLERIQTTVPAYNHLQWERDAKQRVEYLRNMTEFPDYFVPPGSSSKAARSLKESNQRQMRLSTGGSSSDEMAPQPPPDIMGSSPGQSSQSNMNCHSGSRTRLRPITDHNVQSTY